MEYERPVAYDRTPLPQADLDDFLRTHPDWTLEGRALVRTYQFASFPDAVAFVQRVAPIAEAHDHHPDIDIRYRKVTLRLTTHDAGDLTFRDPLVADACDKVL